MNGNEQQATQQTYVQSGGGIPAPGPAPLRDTVPLRRKSPVLATILSSMPGLGQVYVGYYQQGFMCVLVVGTAISLLNSPALSSLYPFIGVFLAFFWIFNMIDANRRALHYNRVAAGLGGEEVPDGFSMPGAGGTVAGGVVLVITGLLLFVNLKFGVSMAWLQDWWPLALVGGGIWLIVKARGEKANP